MSLRRVMSVEEGGFIGAHTLEGRGRQSSRTHRASELLCYKSSDRLGFSYGFGASKAFQTCIFPQFPIGVKSEKPTVENIRKNCTLPMAEHLIRKGDPRAAHGWKYADTRNRSMTDGFANAIVEMMALPLTAIEKCGSSSSIPEARRMGGQNDCAYNG
jgi:hypothetical protein